ncbi:MAG: 1-aminocyclopropane-1-carboxylate deaminase/D-cysteine desulfhydrase [Bacteroidetes bacterium]|nr:1-aminocyclopropane-1-carboxylate deaminase/D-cysteine desulfhydrase [Bacteroidota bacterium]
MFFNIFNAAVDNINNELLQQKNITLSVLRLDKIHPVVSGNKLFKLQFFLTDALESAHQTILTFGGAFSNHLVATAFATRELGLKSIGIVRGEAANELSHTLQQCMAYGMQLHFISREAYREKDSEASLSGYEKKFGSHIMIPEGGYHPSGAKGAALIASLFERNWYTHIATATGTATTAAGLLSSCGKEKIMLIPVLKNMHDVEDRLRFLCGDHYHKEQITILDQYHFGGYAKYNASLLQFMNSIWQQYHIPTDFVYTGKMLYAIFDQIMQDCFEPGSRILCLHTGGLQGNNSLPAGSLLF